MMELLFDPQAWIAFFTLTALELVLGIDNIVFIAILVDKLPEARRNFARRLGLFLAMFMRIGLLLLLFWIVGLTAPLFTIFTEEISGRDLILIGGGLFLIWKSTGEVHHLLERHRLSGRGLGWIDVHLLASARLAAVPLITRDRALRDAAQSVLAT